MIFETVLIFNLIWNLWKLELMSITFSIWNLISLIKSLNHNVSYSSTLSHIQRRRLRRRIFFSRIFFSRIDSFFSQDTTFTRNTCTNYCNSDLSFLIIYSFISNSCARINDVRVKSNIIIIIIIKWYHVQMIWFNLNRISSFSHHNRRKYDIWKNQNQIY